MPAKTGGSHALSAFVSMVVGTVLSKYIWEFTPPLARLGAFVGDVLAAATGVTFSDQQAGGLVVVVGLSFLWGVVYHVTRHGDDDARGSHEREW
jgi:hypothetical protein